MFDYSYDVAHEVAAVIRELDKVSRMAGRPGANLFKIGTAIGAVRVKLEECRERIRDHHIFVPIPATHSGKLAYVRNVQEQLEEFGKTAEDFARSLDATTSGRKRARKAAKLPVAA